MTATANTYHNSSLLGHSSTTHLVTIIYFSIHIISVYPIAWTQVTDPISTAFALIASNK